MYSVIDNFLDDQSFKELQDVMLSNWFPWYKLDYKLNQEIKLSTNEEKHNMQFIHTFYKDNRSWSDFINILQPLTDKLDILAYIRIKANLTTATEKSIFYGFHTDVESDKSTTAIFYINDNNGRTIFKNGDTVESKANRICIFNSQVKHSGSSCTDEKVRCVINLNYIENN